MTTTRPIPFIPKSAADALALQIAQSFGDERRLPLYRKVCGAYDRSVVYRAYREALEIPAEKVKKSRRAIFLYILHDYAHENHARD